MSKDVYWIKLDTNVFDDPKILRLRKEYGWEGFGLYVFFICYMRTQPDYKIKEEDIDVICYDKKIDNFQDILKYCIKIGLFKSEDGYFWSVRLMDDSMIMFKNKSKAGKKSAEKRYGKDYTNEEESSDNSPKNSEPTTSKPKIRW